jgi:hypothetical protein
MKNNKESILLAVSKGYHFDANDNLIGTHKNIIHPRKNNNGYPRFNIKIKGKQISVAVHRLKAYFLYGDLIFREDYEVRHLNGIRADWSNKNIAIGTTHDNRLDMPKEIRLKTAVNATSHMRKITEQQRKEIRDLKDSGLKLIDIAKLYGLKSKGTVSMIINKTRCYNNKAYE